MEARRSLDQWWVPSRAIYEAWPHERKWWQRSVCHVFNFLPSTSQPESNFLTTDRPAGPKVHLTVVPDAYWNGVREWATRTEPGVGRKRMPLLLHGRKVDFKKQAPQWSAWECEKKDLKAHMLEIPRVESLNFSPDSPCQRSIFRLLSSQWNSRD